MGLLGDVIESHARNVNPVYNQKRSREEASAAALELDRRKQLLAVAIEEQQAQRAAQAYESMHAQNPGMNMDMSPVEIADQMMRSGNPMLQQQGQALYGEYQKGKTSEIKIFDYVERLSPEARARWLKQNPTLGREIVHSTFQGDNGNQWMLLKNGATMDTGTPFRRDRQVVNVGDVPHAYMEGTSEAGPNLSPLTTVEEVAKNKAIPAGEVVAEQEAAKYEAELIKDKPKHIMRLNKTRQDTQVLQETISQAQQMVNTITAGVLESGGRIGSEMFGIDVPQASNVGGTMSRDLSEALRTIKARIGFDQLVQLKQATPTGGALGEVSIRELLDLQASLGSLDQGQSADQLKKNLDKINKIYTKVLRSQEKYYEALHGDTAPNWSGEHEAVEAIDPVGKTQEELYKERANKLMGTGGAAEAPPKWYDIYRR